MITSSFETPVGPLLLTVFTSILEVFLLCLAGYVLAGRGILDKKTQKQLNRLNVSLFTPSLLFSKVAFFLSPAKLRELWIIPIFFVIATLASMSVAFLLGWVFRLRRSQRSFAMAAAMFMNSNSLPIALMQSLVVTVPGLKWGNDDNKNAMVGRALTYLVLYSTLGMVLRWSYGVRLLAQADDEVEVAKAADEVNERSPLLSAIDNAFTPDHRPIPSSSTLVADDSDNEPQNGESNTTLRPPPMRRPSKFYNSFPNSPNISATRLPAIDSERPSRTVSTTSTPASLSDSEPEGEPLPTHNRRRRTLDPSTPPPTGLQTFFRRSKRRISRGWIALNDFMTVPLWAALASLVVACIQPMQHTLEEHMQPIKGALAAAGNCSIPVTLVVLGAYFYTPPQDDEGETRGRMLTTTKSTSSLMSSAREMFLRRKARKGKTKKERGTPGETKTVIIAVVSRMIITPLLLLPVMALSTFFDLQAIFEDPVFVVSNVLLISSPPALTLAQITQAASGDAFERLISRTIFWSYCIVTPPATILYVVIGLVLSKL